MLTASSRLLATLFSCVVTVLGQDGQGPDLKPLLARIGSEISWQPSWDRAAAVSRQSKRPVLLVMHEFRSFNIPAHKLLLGLCDIDVWRVVQARFVPVRYSARMGAPLKRSDGKAYNMGPNTLGSALLVVKPDGEVVRETHATTAFGVYDFLLAALAELPDWSGIEAPAGVEPGREAARLLARGDLARAEELIGVPDSAAEHLVMAGLRRRERRGAEALEHLGAARAAGGVASLAQIDLTELVVQLRLGDFAAADRLSRGLGAYGSPTVEAPVVQYWSAVSAICSGDREDGLAMLEMLVDEHPEDRWTWQGAAILAAYGEDSAARLQVEWPSDEMVASLRNPAPADPAASLAIVERDAVAFLHRGQRADGSWISPSELVTRSVDHPFTIAITSLAAGSLLERSEVEGNVEAATRAMQFLLRQHELSKTAPAKKRSFMDYTVWSEGMSLSFFADCLDAGLGDADALRAAMAEKVAHLLTRQRPVGGFSYYITNDLSSKAAKVPDEAMSFTTAAVVLALLRARDVGVEVPAEPLQSSIDAVERARAENGAFAYMIGKGSGGAVGRPGAAGRGPLCELALLRAGRADLDDLRRALEIFRDHRNSFDRELGKALMHCGAQGQGCHYLFFDYATAAATAAALPAEERAQHAEWLLELILPARTVEGGFRDTPINGWPFGTAMALMALHDLRPRPQ